MKGEFDVKSFIMYMLFGVCILLLVNSTLQNCELKKEQTKLRNLQLAYRDSIKAQIERLAAARMDTIPIINNYQKEIIREVEKEKDEIFNLTHIDSIIKRYYQLRPVPADSADR